MRRLQRPLQVQLRGHIDQFLKFQRFDNAGIGPQPFAGCDLTVFRRGAQGDDGYGTEPWVFANPLQDFQAAETREIQVQQNNGWVAVRFALGEPAEQWRKSSTLAPSWTTEMRLVILASLKDCMATITSSVSSST